MQELESLRLMAGLLDQIAGAGEGRRLLARLLEDGEPPDALVRDIVRLPGFGRLRAPKRAGEEAETEPMGPNPKAVGLPPPNPGEGFAARFERDMAPRLGKRREGFETMLAALQGREAPFVVETGCVRKPGNWEGDGQSSVIFDALAEDRGGRFLSIDRSVRSLEVARRVCGPATTLVLNDSVAALADLASLGVRRIDLLYLDSFDLDPADALPSAAHHAQELIAARPLLGRGSIVCVDDYRVRGAAAGGKGAIIDRYMQAARARVLHEGYQKAWILV
jgi:hypothetical protein